MRMHPRHVHHSAVLPDKKPLLSVPNQLALSVLWFALNFQNAALLPIVVPTQILLFSSSGQVGNAQQATLLGWLSALGSVVAMLVAPITGALSDHTRGALGRRRPYIIVASAIFLPGVVLLATARDIAAFAIGFFVFQVASSTCTAAYQSLLPDRVPREQRGTASGYLGLMTILGNVGSLALAGILLSSVSLTSIGSLSIERGANVFYALTSVALLVSVFITLVGVPDEPLTLTPSAAAGSAAETGTRQRFAHLWIAPWRHNNFTWVFLTRAFVMLGLTLFLTFIEYYFANVAHETNFVEATATLAVLALLGAVCSAFLLGVLSDREARGAPPLAPSTPSVPGARRQHIARGWSLAFRTRAGRARGFLRFWPVWEHITLLVHPTHPIPHASANVLRTQLTRWRGRPITLPDGTQVARGDLVVELHVNNRALGEVLAHASDWRLLPLLPADLRARAGPKGPSVFPHEVRAVYGFTLLSRAAPRLGFTVRSRPHTVRAWLDRVFLMGLLPLYNPRGVDRLQQGTIYTSYPPEVWMSCDELLRRYGDVGYARAE